MAISSLQLVCCIAMAVFFCIDRLEGYDNAWDGHLYVRCSYYKAISSVYSVHSNGHEDRRFSINCRDVPVTRGSRSCNYGRDWENGFDQPLTFHCPANRYIVKMESRHYNRDEDRKWAFGCCGFSETVLYDCESTGWTNDYDGVQDYTVPHGSVITGVTSIHSNYHEDRIYRFNICKVIRRFYE